MEVKTAYSTAVNFSTGATMISDVLFNHSITPGDKYRLMPGITIGTFNGNRVGNQIQPLSFKVQLCLSLSLPSATASGGYISSTTDSGPEDLTAHVYFLKSKKFPDYDNMGSISLTSMLTPMANYGVYSGFTGDWWTAKSIVNSNDFTLIKHLQVRLTKGAGYQSYMAQINETGDGNPQQALFATDVSGRPWAYHTVNIPVPKMLQYKDTTSSQPVDYNPFMVIGWVRNSYPFAVLGANTTFPLAVSARTLFRYKDI